MAIQISGCTVIDNSRNITNANNMCVGVVTMTGSSGDIETPGTITAGGIDFPLSIVSFYPSDGETDVSPDTEIRINFDQAIGIGSTGFVKIKTGSGSISDTFGVGSTYISRTDSNKTLVITPSSPFASGVLGGGNTITTIVDASFIDDPAFTGINTTGSDVTYEFETEYVALGESYEGGYLICAAGGTQWIVAPSSTEVSRSWHARNDAATTANASAACGDWFVPSIGQLQNPGFTCRTYWDSYCSTHYWSSTEASSPNAWDMSMSTGGTGFDPPGYTKTFTNCVRAFRCVSY